MTKHEKELIEAALEFHAWTLGPKFKDDVAQLGAMTAAKIQAKAVKEVLKERKGGKGSLTDRQLGFEQGCLWACAWLVLAHGETTLSRYMLSECGVDPKNADPYDRKALKGVIKELRDHRESWSRHCARRVEESKK